MELKRVQSNIGMGILLISWSMLFASLFLSYFVFRFSQDSWPPMGMAKVSLLWPSLSMVLMLVSSYAYNKFQTGYLTGNKKDSLKILQATILLAALFLACQFLLWSDMKAIGLYASAGIFPSLLYGFTWIHWAHVILAVPALVFLAYSLGVNNRFKMGELSIINIGRFWHFLGIIWLLIYLALFVF